MSGGPRRPSRSPDDRRRALASGHEAEAWVAQELEALGWQVLGRNVHVGGGELDLIVIRGGCVRFVEVKARKPGEDGLEAITDHKQGKLRRAAEGWLQQHGGRFDEVAFLVAVVHMEGRWRLELLDDAF
jgi:putative endonuclease